MEDIKVLAFDTGGTVLDWHAGLTAAFAAWGAAQGIERDWHALANEHRRRSLHRMINTVDPGFNIGEVHRDVLGELFDENGLGGSAEERQAIAERWHQLDAWPDFAAESRVPLIARCKGTPRARPWPQTHPESGVVNDE
jgi:2-haloacid dehalogenase